MCGCAPQATCPHKKSIAHTYTHISEKNPRPFPQELLFLKKKKLHPFPQNLPHPHTHSLQLRQQKYESSNEDEPINFEEQARTLVQTLVHFFQVQDKK